MDERLETIKHLVEANKTFLLATHPSAEIAFLLAREALRYALDQNGKEIITTPILSDAEAQLLGAIAPSYSGKTIPQKLVIAFPKEKPGEISYHEKENEMMFIITPKEPLAKEDISIREMPPEVDAAFFFFPHTDPMYERAIETAVLPAREKTVFLIENEKTIAEKIYAITCTLPFQTPRNESVWATLLYFSLLSETRHFKTKISSSLFSLAASLLLRGARLEDAPRLQTISMQEVSLLSSFHILGRALARTHIDESTNSSWTFLTQKDFQKSGIAGEIKERVIEKIMTHIETMLSAMHALCIVWEGNPHIYCMVKSGNKDLITKCESEELFVCKDTICRGGKFDTFTAAELRMRSLLKGAIPHNIAS